MSEAIRYALAASGEAMREVRRSRFWGYAGAVGDDGAGLGAFLEAVSRRHREAGHVVYAWRGDTGRTRASDDGEPHGTGGRPCLDVLERAGLVGAAVAVARLFGGVLLGVGGLSRAYGETASAAVSDAGVRPLRMVQTVTVRAAFADESVLQRLVDRFEAPPERSYGADGVRLCGDVEAAAVEALRATAQAATAGRALVRLEGAPRWR